MISSAVVEAHHNGLWLKASVIVFDQREIQRQVALPGHSEHNLMRTIGTVEPRDVWILDWSTREGAAFNIEQDSRYAMSKISANL